MRVFSEASTKSWLSAALSQAAGLVAAALMALAVYNAVVWVHRRRLSPPTDRAHDKGQVKAEEVEEMMAILKRKQIEKAVHDVLDEAISDFEMERGSDVEFDGKEWKIGDTKMVETQMEDEQDDQENGKRDGRGEKTKEDELMFGEELERECRERHQVSPGGKQHVPKSTASEKTVLTAAVRLQPESHGQLCRTGDVTSHTWHHVLTDVIEEEDESNGDLESREATMPRLDTMATANGAVLVARMPWGGDSLFAALAHQIYEPAVGSADHWEHAVRLRAAAVAHLRSNSWRYWDQLVQSAREHGPRYGDGRSDERAVDEYLRDLGHLGFPAGGECVSAVADVVGVDVLVCVEGLAAYPVPSLRGGAFRSVAIAKRSPMWRGARGCRFDSVVRVASRR